MNSCPWRFCCCDELGRVENGWRRKWKILAHTFFSFLCICDMSTYKLRFEESRNRCKKYPCDEIKVVKYLYVYITLEVWCWWKECKLSYWKCEMMPSIGYQSRSLLKVEVPVSMTPDSKWFCMRTRFWKNLHVQDVHMHGNLFFLIMCWHWGPSRLFFSTYIQLIAASCK